MSPAKKWRKNWPRTKPRIALARRRRRRRGAATSADNGNTSISITAWQMQPGDDKIVADRLHEVLSRSAARDREPAAPATNLSGRWDVNVEFFSSKSQHTLFLKQDGNRINGSHKGDFSVRDVFGTIEGDQIKLRSNTTERAAAIRSVHFRRLTFRRHDFRHDLHGRIPQREVHGEAASLCGRLEYHRAAGRTAARELTVGNQKFRARRQPALPRRIRLAATDGFEATDAIRRKEQYRAARIPIMAMTAHAMRGDRACCLAVGSSRRLSSGVKEATPPGSAKCRSDRGPNVVNRNI